MGILSNPERRGIAGMTLIVLIILAVMAVMNGYLEKWFNITWLSGPSIENSYVYISERSGNPELYIQQDNSEAVKITEGAHPSGIPAVAPNARKILFIAAYKGSDSIYSIRGDGKGLSQLTEASGPKAHPAFSTTGKQIYYLASNKLYIAQADGSAPKFVLPTREEQSIAITQGQESPKYREYAWEDSGKGILAACESGPDVEQLVYLSEPGKDAVRIPLSPDPTERVSISGITPIPDTKAFIVSVNIGNSSMIAYLDPSGSDMRPLGRFENSEIGGSAVNSSGNLAVACIRDTKTAGKSGLFVFSISGDTPKVISNEYFEDISFYEGSSKILATLVDKTSNERNIATVNIDSGEIKKITTDGKSYSAVFCSKPEK